MKKKKPLKLTRTWEKLIADKQWQHFLKMESGWAVLNTLAKCRKQIAKCLKRETQGDASCRTWDSPREWRHKILGGVEVMIVIERWVKFWTKSTYSCSSTCYILVITATLVGKVSLFFEDMKLERLLSSGSISVQWRLKTRGRSEIIFRFYF